MEQVEMFGELRNYKALKKYRDGVFKTKAEIEEECRREGRTNIYYILSFGAGTQSTHLLEEHIQAYIRQGETKIGEKRGHYHAVLFGDTGAEPIFVLEQVEWWKNRMKELGCETPFITVKNTKYEKGIEEVLMRYILTDEKGIKIPIHCNAYDKETDVEIEGGQLKRQCTADFKIRPVQQAARKVVYDDYELEYSKRFPKDAAIITDLGFSYDEVRRVNRYVSDHKYMYLAYPLIEQNLSTEDSIRFLQENHMPDKRSRCYLCPYNCEQIGFSWSEIIEYEPLSFLKACYIDDEIRRATERGGKNIKSILYLHKSRKPLKEVYPDHYYFLSAILRKELENWVSAWKILLTDKHSKRAG